MTAKPRLHLAAGATLLSLPALGVLSLLVGLGHLRVGPALTGFALVWILAGLVLRPYLRDLADLRDWVTGLETDPCLPPPPLRRGRPLHGLVIALGNLRRTWNQRQADLVRTAQWNESLLDNLPDPLLLLDGERRLSRVNQAAAALFGAGAVGKELAAVLRHPGVLEATDRVLHKSVGSELELTLPVPVERTFRVRVEPLAGATMDGSRAIIALHDISAAKKIENMRADFVANASHELRTPLATLSGFIETLQGPARDDAQARDQFLAIMQEQAGRMSRLINDLLSLSRIELNEHSAPMEKVNLGAVLERTAQALTPLAAKKSIQIRLYIAPAAAHVVGQADELAQLAQNLMDNAVKYGHDGTLVTVRLDLPGPLPPQAGSALKSGAVHLSVQDQGDGIAKEHLPRLTERFYRVDTARSRKLGGTGLGLAIVKHIISRHRGVLTIDSVVGQGSIFSVYLPLAK